MTAAQYHDVPLDDLPTRELIEKEAYRRYGLRPTEPPRCKCCGERFTTRIWVQSSIYPNSVTFTG